MSEDAIIAARMARQAAEDMQQAARNMQDTLNQFVMLWECDIKISLQDLAERLGK